MSSAFVDPRAAQWATAGHGRSPTLQLRHTIDDKLMIATHNAFLSLRAMFHRNLDNMILLSEEVHERKLNRRSETLNSKSFVITNKHVYLLGLPGRELFTPASLGACFQISELSRICSASESCIIILQFVNGVIAIQAASEHSANRIAEVLFSASGVSLEQISVNEMETAGVGSSHFSRDTIKYSVSVAPSTTSRNGKFSSRQSVGMSSDISSRGIDNVLRDILRGGEEDTPVTRHASVSTQTDRPDSRDIAIEVSPSIVERATSPIAMYFEQRRENPRDEVASERTSSTANSEFDTADVWKSLRRTPPTPVGRPALNTSSSLRLQNQASSIKQPFPKTTKSREDEIPRKESPRQSSKPVDQKDRFDSAEPVSQGNLEQFLGVLSVYIPGLLACGIDSTSKLVGLNDNEIDRVLDDANITKQGHRLLMHSKLSLHRGR
ncbi:Hypothetical protein, putative [Bodo saltans]|uniref:Uncharacterized protein n=1 Tax=Bodo saltans TaxID=75058 RepID=A0A0S4IWW8_BODSA|nr:Hypothetical protein, putative [Bodo saltans]|eukprot:CUG06135.1 Hypothetical protein, putative [Bodo saltans]